MITISDKIIDVKTDKYPQKENKKNTPDETNPRLEELKGVTYKIKTPLSASALYVTINDIQNPDGSLAPYEIFINSKNMEHYQWIVALTRVLSAVFRKGGEVKFIIEELKLVFDPKGGYWKKGKYIPSLVSEIGDIIEKHFIDIGVIQGVKKESAGVNKTLGDCPNCGNRSLAHTDGCVTCTSCGYSKCG